MTTDPTDSGHLGRRRLLWLIPAGLSLAAWLAGLLWPQQLVRLGIHDYGTRFLDSYAVLAALDAVRAGADPHVANALDPLMRFHVYSDWWLGLRWLGLTRAHNDFVAAAWVLAFVLAACGTMRPRRVGEAVWLAVLMVAPAVALVLNRANNELVIFVLLAGCGVAAAGGAWRPVLAIGLLGLATGLKYYPVVAAMPLLWVRPTRGIPWVWLAALFAGCVVLASVWSQVDRSRFMIGSGVYTMGAPLLWRDLGWEDARSMLPGMLLLGLLAGGLTLFRITTGLAGQGSLRERLLAAIGATVILACFFAGVNYAYRWIFVLWPAFWLWRRAGDESLPGRPRVVAAIGCALVVFALWQDGIFCAFINAQPPRDTAWVDHAQRIYRLWTQPWQWLLMGMLAGWLLEGVLTLVREGRMQSRAS
jgi:hypothetical protein